MVDLTVMPPIALDLTAKTVAEAHSNGTNQGGKVYDFSKCLVCMVGTKLPGKMMCAGCFNAMRNEMAAKVRMEMARGQRNRTIIARRTVQGRIHTPPAKPREIVRKWWEVSYIGDEGIRVTKKFGNAKTAVTKYAEFDEEKRNGLTLVEMRNGARTQLLPQTHPEGTL